MTPSSPEPAAARNHVDRLAGESSLAEQLSVNDEIDVEPEHVTLDLQVPEL